MSIKNDFRDLHDYLRLLTFVEVETGLAGARVLKKITEEVMNKIGEIFSPSLWSFLLLDQTKGEFFYKLNDGKQSDKLKGFWIPRGKGAAAWVLENGESYLVKNVRRKPLRFKYLNEKTGLKAKSIVMSPLKLNDKIIGAFEIVNVGWRKKFNINDQRMLSSIADCTAFFIENVVYLSALKDMDKADTLTGIHSRKSFERHLSEEGERCKRIRHPLALIFIEIDNLKMIYKEHGTDKGERVLKDAARLVKTEVRRIDVAARYEENKFAVLMPHTSRIEAEIASKRIVDNLNKDINQEIEIKINIGIGAAGPEKVTDLIEITEVDLLQRKKTK